VVVSVVVALVALVSDVELELSSVFVQATAKRTRTRTERTATAFFMLSPCRRTSTTNAQKKNAPPKRGAQKAND
jgi:hypothetical protein